MADDDQPPLIRVDDRQTDAVDVESLSALARQCLVAEGVSDTELSVSFVTEDEMADLHRRYLHEEGPTDVLSFPLDQEVGETGLRLVGDVVIAPAVAARNHPDDPAAELRLLLVHGILHALGHDHVAEADRAAMWALQERYSGVKVQ